jgi:glycerophosphoryl diester phosphodiesterase
VTHPYLEGPKHPRILAHRGLVTPADEDSAVWENTAAAFAAAHAAGAEYIETDCRLSADGDVVLVHDDTLARLNGDTRPVDSLRTVELERIFADHGGLMTVRDALASFPGIRFNIDAKTNAVAAPLGRIVAAEAHRVLVTSFDDARRKVTVAAALDAGADIRPATSGGRNTILALRSLTALHLSPARVLTDIDALQIPERQGPVRLVTPTLVRAAQRLGVEVHVWTVNDPDDMVRLAAAGVDGIVSDRADLAIAALHTP